MNLIGPTINDSMSYDKLLENDVGRKAKKHKRKVWNFCKNLLHYTNICEAHWLLPYKRCLSHTVMMLCVDHDEEAMKVFSSSPTAIVHPLQLKCFGMWLIQSFPLKFTDHLAQSNTDRYLQNNTFDFQIAHICPTGNITMQCGFSAGKQKLTVILV